MVTIEHAVINVIWLSASKSREFWDVPTIIATDCQNVAMQMKTTTNDLSTIGSMMRGLQIYLRQAPNWTVCYFLRYTNAIAHRLASIPLNLDLEVIWLYSSHPQMMELLHAEWLLLQ